MYNKYGSTLILKKRTVTTITEANEISVSNTPTVLKLKKKDNRKVIITILDLLTFYSGSRLSYLLIYDHVLGK